MCVLCRCCCAEWVDEGLSVQVKFNVTNEKDALLTNDIFVHYFAESELEEYKQNIERDHGNPLLSGQIEPSVPFDGLSCTAFKLDKLKIGKQAQRIAAFEEQNKP